MHIRTMAFIACFAGFSLRAFADKISCSIALTNDINIEEEHRGPGGSEWVIRLSDKANPRYFAYGYLQGERMEFVMRTKYEDGGKSKVLRGSEAFTVLLSKFGERVKEIHSHWRWGDSFTVFNTLTGEGMSSVEAAKKTWSGQQALRAGFTEVDVYFEYGTPGKYNDVKVIFRKP